jgi:ribA/ribD-fused uncharacterized protein
VTHAGNSVLEFTGRNEFLSNFHRSHVYIMIGAKWVRGPTVEHGFQAQKTLSPEKRQCIVEAPTPGEAKKLGRQLIQVGYWEDVKRIIMLELLRQKFSRRALAKRLLATGDMPLVEGNYWHDNYWGVCRCNGPECTGGENWLGKLLMRVRKDI